MEQARKRAKSRLQKQVRYIDTGNRAVGKPGLTLKPFYSYDAQCRK